MLLYAAADKLIIVENKLIGIPNKYVVTIGTAYPSRGSRPCSTAVECRHKMSQDDLPLAMLIIVFQIVNFADAYRIKSEFLNHVTDLIG